METYSYYAGGKWLEGMCDFLQTKSVWLSTAREIQAPF